MEHLNVQGKGNKVAATQGKITAQNPKNQSKNEEKILGVFTREDLEDIGKTIFNGNQIMRPRFIVDYFTRLDQIISKLRTSPDVKGMITSGYGFLAYAIPSYRPVFTFTAQSYWPAEIENEDCVDEDEVQSAVEEEVGFIINDINTMLEDNEDGYYDETIAEYLEQANEYISAGRCRCEDLDLDEFIWKSLQEIEERETTKVHYRAYSE